MNDIEQAKALQPSKPTAMKKKKVFRLYPEGMRSGSFILDTDKALRNDGIAEVPSLKDLQKGDKFIIEVDTMTREEIAALREFDGF